MYRRAAKEVTCANCGWEGHETELEKVYDGIEMTELDKCPKCKDSWKLLNKEEEFKRGYRKWRLKL